MNHSTDVPQAELVVALGGGGEEVEGGVVVHVQCCIHHPRRHWLVRLWKVPVSKDDYELSNKNE